MNLNTKKELTEAYSRQRAMRDMKLSKFFTKHWKSIRLPKWIPHNSHLLEAPHSDLWETKRLSVPIALYAYSGSGTRELPEHVLSDNAHLTNSGVKKNEATFVMTFVVYVWMMKRAHEIKKKKEKNTPNAAVVY